MSANTKIEWADATVNWWAGCTAVSPACDHCYAERMAGRLWGTQWGSGQQRQRFEGTFKTLDALDRKAKRLGRPLTVFHNSLSDFFDNEVPESWRIDAISAMEQTPNLIHLLLTKRIGNVAAMLPWSACSEPWPNVWIGATIVNREEMLRDAGKLKAVPARVHFWSVGPMLGDLGEIPRDLMPEWVICEGESGPGARPMHPDWARSLRDQCQAAGVPFLFKQWGEWAPDWEGAESCGNCGGTKFDYINSYGECGRCGIEDWRTADKPLDALRRVGKKAAGRLLDGRTWDEVPA